MEFLCRHCDAIVCGQPYRVTSEDEGMILLDMMVCRACYEQAQALGLHSEPIPVERPWPRRDEYRRINAAR